RLARDARIAVGHVDRGILGAAIDDADAGIFQRVPQRVVAAAHAEEILRAVGFERLGDGFGDGARHQLAFALSSVRSRSSTAGGVAISRSVSDWRSSPVTGSTSRCSLAVSARNSLSCIVAAKALRSAATRSAGTSGGVKKGRP